MAATPLRIGDYDILDTLGSGSFSVVKSAVHRLSSRHVAIKVVAKSVLEDARIAEAFDNELFIFRSLQHPSIVQFIEHLEDRVNHYVVMELCDGGPLLNHILKHTKLPEPTAIPLMSQIIGALRHLHSLGFVHRDVKAENILLDGRNRAKLSDFGFSCEAAGLLTAQCGSLCYTAPEVCSGLAYLGQPADVWSCGVLLYIMVTGMLPWSSVSNVPALMAEIRRADCRPPWYVSRPCQDLLRRLLTPNPAQRITLEEAASHRWLADGPGSPELTRSVTSFTQLLMVKPGLPRKRKTSLLSFPPLENGREGWGDESEGV
jgi:serine/threonine protein kinase